MRFLKVQSSSIADLLSNIDVSEITKKSLDEEQAAALNEKKRKMPDFSDDLIFLSVTPDKSSYRTCGFKFPITGVYQAPDGPPTGSLGRPR
jgi:hypothetical protein